MATMSRDNSAMSLQGFSIYQPVFGAPLQFFPALGTQELDDLIDTFVPGTASISEKRSTVTVDFFMYAAQTGTNFKYYQVYYSSPSTSFTDSPVSVQDSSFGSGFDALAAVNSWSGFEFDGASSDFGAAASSSSQTASVISSPDSFSRTAAPTPSASSSASRTFSTVSSSRRTSSTTAVDFSSLPGMKIMTRDGRDVTNSASRGCKTKEQRDHAHLMRIIKACDACRRKKIRCDPSHKKRSAAASSAAASSSQIAASGTASTSSPAAVSHKQPTQQQRQRAVAGNHQATTSTKVLGKGSAPYRLPPQPETPSVTTPLSDSPLESAVPQELDFLLSTDDFSQFVSYGDDDDVVLDKDIRHEQHVSHHHNSNHDNLSTQSGRVPQAPAPFEDIAPLLTEQFFDGLSHQPTLNRRFEPAFWMDVPIPDVDYKNVSSGSSPSSSQAILGTPASLEVETNVSSSPCGHDYAQSSFGDSVPELVLGSKSASPVSSPGTVVSRGASPVLATPSPPGGVVVVSGSPATSTVGVFLDGAGEMDLARKTRRAPRSRKASPIVAAHAQAFVEEQTMPSVPITSSSSDEKSGCQLASSPSTTTSGKSTSTTVQHETQPGSTQLPEQIYTAPSSTSRGCPHSDKTVVPVQDSQQQGLASAAVAAVTTPSTTSSQISTKSTPAAVGQRFVPSRGYAPGVFSSSSTAAMSGLLGRCIQLLGRVGEMVAKSTRMWARV